MTKRQVFKSNDQWAVLYPGYGFGRSAIVTFETWRSAANAAFSLKAEGGINVQIADRYDFNTDMYGVGQLWA